MRDLPPTAAQPRTLFPAVTQAQQGRGSDMVSDSGADFTFTDADGKKYYMQMKRTSPRGLFAALCQKHGIARSRIQDMTVQELDDALNRLDDLEVDWKTNPSVLTMGEQYNVEVASRIISLRKSINERMFDLTLQESMDQIKDAVESNVKDSAAREVVLGVVDEGAKRQNEAAAEKKAREDALDEEMRRLAAQEKKINNIKSMFDRELAAVIIGGILLVALTITLVIAMFTHTAVPEIFTSMVLLILGFFFGHTTSGKRSGSDS